MLKAKLIEIFKKMFGGVFSKENGKVYWSSGDFKEMVSFGFLKHHIDAKKSPVSTKTEPVVEEPKKEKKPAKKAKKNVKPTTNPEVSEGS
jgi:hypothetical protein